jgi:hypothetical protein
VAINIQNILRLVLLSILLVESKSLLSCERGLLIEAETPEGLIDSIDGIAVKQEREPAAEKADYRMNCDSMPYKLVGRGSEDHKLIQRGNNCVDKSCVDEGDEELLSVFDEVFDEGVACLMGQAKQTAANAIDPLVIEGLMEKIKNRIPLTSDEIATVKSNFSLKNAALISSLASGNGDFAKLIDLQSQSPAIREYGVNKYHLRLRKEEELDQLYNPTNRSRVKFYCSSNDDISIHETINGATFVASIGPELGFSPFVMRAAYLGGVAWPRVNLKRHVFYNTFPNWKESTKAAIFHELFHNIGYPHGNNINSITLGDKAIPVHTACTICCFPNGNTSPSIGSSPTCLVEDRQHACRICRGDYGSSKEEIKSQTYQNAEKKYLKRTSMCTSYGNPQ